MDAITYSAARANLASTMDRVCNDHEALIITRNGEQSVVMLSLEDFQSLEETAYLLRSPANTKRLLTAIEQLNAGRGDERALDP
jgi:antitoxin YefM